MSCHAGLLALVALLAAASSCAESPTPSALPTISAPGPSSTAVCSNEPTGYTVINDDALKDVPAWPATNSQGWIDDERNAKATISIVNDPTSLFPSINHNVAAGAFNKGAPGGSAPFFVYRPFAPQEQFRNLYICLYLKQSDNFTSNGNAGTKFLWPSGDQVTGTMTYNGHDGANLDFQFFQQGPVDRQLAANMNATSATMVSRRGQWVLYEMLLKANSDNSTANGELHVWIDGVETHRYSDVDWQMGSARTWLSLAWSPVYGGGLNPVPETMFEYMDHVRVSGSNR